MPLGNTHSQSIKLYPNQDIKFTAFSCNCHTVENIMMLFVIFVYINTIVNIFLIALYFPLTTSLVLDMTGPTPSFLKHDFFLSREKNYAKIRGHSCYYRLT